MFPLQVDEAVDQAQLDVQAGPGDQEFGDGRCQVAAAEGCRRVDADQSLRCAAQRHRLGPGLAQLVEDAPGAFGKGQAGWSGLDCMGAALKQRAAKGSLQGVDAPRHRRGGELLAAGGGREAAAGQYIEEQVELAGQGVRVHRQSALQEWQSHCAWLCVSQVAMPA
ncbi:hypothetical protein D3C81_1478360 [compost metagenome]